MPQKKTLEKYAQKPRRIRTPEDRRRGEEALAQMVGMASLMGAHMPNVRISDYTPVNLSQTRRTKPGRSGR